MNSLLSDAASRAAAALVGFLLCSTSSAEPAQCPANDAFAGNADCSSPAAIVLGTTPGLSVQANAQDFWTYVVPAGERLTLDVGFIHVGITGDIDLQLYDANSSCTGTLDSSANIGNLERVSYDNASSNPFAVTLRVFLFGAPAPAGACADYSLTASLSPTSSNCFGLPDDAEEDNDTCQSALTPSTNPLPGLFVSKVDEDHWTIAPLLPGEILTVSAIFSAASGDIDIELIDASDCTTVLVQAGTSGDNETVTFNNTTGATLSVVARIFVWAGAPSDCNTYEFSTSRIIDPCTLVPDDAFEENDTCSNPSPITSGIYSGLFARQEMVDEDWYSIDVPDGIKLTVTVTHVVADGNLDIELYDACFANPVDSSITSAPVEAVNWTNTGGLTINARFGIWIRSFGSDDCTNYDMQVQLSGGGPGNIVPYCFGDGSGATCPCGNNSSPGHPGGCANSVGDGGVLVASGVPSVNNDSLNLDLSSAASDSFALLVSGANQLPQMGGCIGCGLPAFDGLRCAGGVFSRHGSRAIDSMGETGNGWGPPGGPAGGLIQKHGFVSGQTRHFFAFYRDNPMTSCLTGQNSSNGVSVTFQP